MLTCYLRLWDRDGTVTLLIGTGFLDQNFPNSIPIPPSVNGQTSTFQQNN